MTGRGAQRPGGPQDAARQHFGLTFGVLSLGAVSYALLQSMVAPALPTIQHDLHTSTTLVTWVLTAYLLSASVSTPIAGRLGDMLGKERMLLTVLILLGVGTLVAGLAHSIGVLILGRVIQGLGGGVFPLAFGIIRDEFPRERVAGGIGLMSTILGIGAGAGIVLAGPIVGAFSYHWLFWFPLIVIVIAAVATHRFVPESPIKAPGGIGWLGSLLLSAWLVTLLLGVSLGPTWGWGSPGFLGCMAATVVLIGVWVAAERRSAQPLVDMRMMGLRGVWTTNLVALLLGFGMFGSFVLIPQFVQAPARAGYGFHASVTGAGLFLLPSTVGMLLAGPVAGRLDRTVGSRVPLILGAVFSALAFGMLAVAHRHPLEIYVATALMGVGIGLAFAAMANLIVEAVDQTQTGIATGMNTITRNIGGAIGGQVSATIVTAGVIAGGLPTEHGFTLAFGLSAGALVIGLLAALAVPRRGPLAPDLAAPVPAPVRRSEPAVTVSSG